MGVPLADPPRDWVDDGEGDTVAEVDSVARDTLLVGVCVPLTVGDTVDAPVADGVSDGVGLGDGGGVSDCELVGVTLALAPSVVLCEDVDVGVDVALPLADPLADSSVEDDGA